MIGKVVYLNAVNQPILVVNDYDAAVELMERRSAIYSSRPPLKMATMYVFKTALG